MKCLNTLLLEGSGIREVPSSIEHLTKLQKLDLEYCENVQDLPDSIYKLQQLGELKIPTGKLRPTYNSFDSSSGYGFVKMERLTFRGYEGIIELDLLMKPDYFPALKEIDLSETNVVTIPESISRFPRLNKLWIRDCELLREIQGLPQSIRSVDAWNCMLLDTQSPSGLLSQVIEIFGILPSRICGRARSNKFMDPQLTNYFPSETEGAESEDRDISMDPQFSNNFPSEIEGAESEDEYESETETAGAESEDEYESETEGVEYEDRDVFHYITCWGTEMPKWFNHQSVDNSISFYVGREFPKLVVCFVPGRKNFSGSVHISINGYKNSKKLSFVGYEGNNLHLSAITQRFLQRRLNESNPTDQNLVEVSIKCSSIKSWGIHVECTCPPQESANAPIQYSIKRMGVQLDDVVDYLPNSKKLRAR